MTNVALINVSNRSADQQVINSRASPPAIVQNFVAGGSLTINRGVKFGAVAGEVIASAAATDLHLGIYTGSVNAVAGDSVPIALGGIVTAEAGAAVAQGAMVTLDATARVITAVATNRLIGKALQPAAAAGALIKVLLSDQSLVA